jgi:hypothetical protein
VLNKTFWVPAGHVKVAFSFILERISKKYESFGCFLSGVGRTFGRTLQLIKVTAFDIQYIAKIN